MNAEEKRLAEDQARAKNWKRWGPYLAGRQWGTVREDYSADGDCWNYFPHEQAHKRAYRWGEDGLLGFTDRECRLCFALALWNGRDPILKERLFGLTGPQGNHGEDVKECYFYLNSTPTHSYLKALYKYPQREFPYAQLVEVNRQRTRQEPEFELVDTGVFDENRYFDIIAEYAKASPDDILIRLTLANRGPEAAALHVLPTLWFRNTWSWGRTEEGETEGSLKPRIAPGDSAKVPLLQALHHTLGHFTLAAAPGPNGELPLVLFTENESNLTELFGTPNAGLFVKDAFHKFVIEKRTEAINPRLEGTKAAFCYQLVVPAQGEVSLQLRLAPAGENGVPFGERFERVFADRIREADEFYAAQMPRNMSSPERAIVRQAWAGLFWSKQFYHFAVKEWLEGDPTAPPPANRKNGRNHDWLHLYNRDVLSIPDKWEYPWYAA